MSKARLKVAALGSSSLQVIITRLKLEKPMRVQLVGNYNLDEFQEAIAKVISDFRENEVNSFRYISLYFRPCVDGQEIELTDDGKLVDHMVYDLERKKQIPVKSGELSVVTSHKVIVESTKSET